MAPTMFTTHPSESSRPQQQPPPKSRLKTFSQFLSNPFTSSIDPLPAKSHLVPSAPMPLQPTSKLHDDVEMDLSLPTTSGSPFRVYLRDREVVGLPSSGTQVPLLALDSTNEMDKSTWKEMPTLASAIHISDAAPPAFSSTFGPTRPLPKSSFVPPPLSGRSHSDDPSNNNRPESASNPVNGGTNQSRILRRTSSKSSATGSISANSKAPENTLRRRMSRRLSLDNILPIFHGGMRKKDRVTSGSGKVLGNGDDDDDQGIHRWSMVENQNKTHTQTNSPLQRPVAPKASRMALPPMRGLRSKFAVASGGGSNAGVMAAAKADVKARQKERYEKRDEVEMGSISSRGGMSITSDGTAAKKEKMISRKALPEWEMETFAGGKAPIPPVAPRPVPPRQSSTIYRRPPMTQVLASPLHSSSPKRIQPVAAPGPPSPERPVTASSALNNVLSPAQDDISLLDPQRSPIPFSDSTSTLAPSPPRASAGKVSHQHDSPKARRQQSLTELKQAYTRMRKISGVDVSTTLTKANDVAHSPRHRDAMLRRKHVSRPSVDLPAIEQGLKAVVDSNMADATLGSTTTLTDKPLSNVPSETATSITSSSSTASTAVTTNSMHTEMSQTQSGRSWHTAKEDVPLPTLPRSRSKSTHDLSTLALLDQVEKQQGEGWWSSTERPKPLNRRASNLESLKARRHSEDDEVEDRRLAQLERLAKSSTLPHRDRFADPESPSTIAEAATATPTQSYRYRELPPLPTEGRQPRPASSFDVRPKGLRISALPPRMLMDGEIPWRPASVQPTRQSAFVHGPRPSLVAGNTWRHAESEIIVRRRGSGIINPRGTPYPDEETPTRPRAAGSGSGSGSGCGTGTSRLTSGSLFATSKISPDIARRASWITKRSDEGKDGKPSQPVKRMVEEEVEKKMEAVKEKYQLEMEALLGALKAAKDECAGLKNEVEGLKRVVGEGGEREAREMRDDEIRPSRPRSMSTSSTLLPMTLANSVSPLSSETCPLEPDLTGYTYTFPSPSPRSVKPRDISAIDEFGRKCFAPQPQPMTARNVSASTCRSNILDESFGTEEDGNEDWTLKLREADEAHLDDL